MLQPGMSFLAGSQISCDLRPEKFGLTHVLANLFITFLPFRHSLTISSIIIIIIIIIITITITITTTTTTTTTFKYREHTIL
jgi:hypothetical protein